MNHWHKRYHSDALTGYRGLNLEQRGAYSTILDLLYDSGEDAIPGLDRWMAGQLDCSIRKWRLIRDELAQLQKITILPDGRITNRRYLSERAKQQQLSEKRAEAGRKGGQQSFGQGTLPLDRDAQSARDMPIHNDMNRPNIASSRKDKARETKRKPAENRDDAQASACDLPPIRARVLEARIRESYQTNESLESKDRRKSEIERSDGRDNLPDACPPIEPSAPPLDRSDLKALVDACSDASGYRPASPGQIAKAFDQIREWREAGIDFEKTALPVIRKATAETSDPTGSFKRFDRAIRHEHARVGASAKSGIAHKPPEAPIIDRDDEPASMRPIRTALLKALGPSLYVALAHRARLEPDRSGNDKPVLRIHQSGAARLFDDDRIPIVQRIARAHGYSDVWGA